MKTIEVTLPTIKDLEIQERLSRLSSTSIALSKTLSNKTQTLVIKAVRTSKALLEYSFRGIKRVGQLRKNNLGEIREINTNQGEYSPVPKMKKFKFPTMDKRNIKRAIYLVIALFILASVVSVFSNRNSSDKRIEIEGARSAQELNKEFSFPLLSIDNEVVSDLKYEILTVEKRDEIVVRGQKATAVKGRTFLVLNIKITNNYSEPIEIDTIDYVRLSVNGKEGEQMAADIHNDPVSVQPISTKYSRIGFPINDTDTDLMLRIGEINGEKESLKLEL